MQLDILKNEEKRTNFVMFLFYAVVPLVAFLYVLIFNGGAFKDSIAVSMVLVGVLVKLFEKNLGKYAKYIYVSILPVFGSITIVAGTPRAFGAMAEAYFLILFLAVSYYDLSTIVVYSVVLVVSNAIGMILFPDAYLCMYTLAIWVFILMVYVLAVLAALMVITRARSLFARWRRRSRKQRKSWGMCARHLWEFRNLQTAFIHRSADSGRARRR